MNFLDYFIAADSSDEDDENTISDKTNTRILRKRLRDHSEPLSFENFIFKQRFRITKEAFSILEEKLSLKWGKTSAAIPPRLKLCATLEILRSGSYQTVIGNDYSVGMAQSTISTVLSETLDVMERVLCPEYISFQPTQATKTHFFDRFNFPGVVGCVDGTHVYLLKPSVNEHSYLNRKMRHSLNVMIICDENKKIMAIDATYGGSNHDAFVWSNSQEKIFLEQYCQEHPNSWLLGDSGYGLEPWLMTPYRQAEEDSPEARYNTTHSKARSIIERSIGLWKGRWRVLLSERQCRYKPEKVAKICNVCAALHNLCILLKINSSDIQIVMDDDITLPLPIDLPNSSNARLRSLAEQKRNRIRDTL